MYYSIQDTAIWQLFNYCTSNYCNISLGGITICKWAKNDLGNILMKVSSCLSWLKRHWIRYSFFPTFLNVPPHVVILLPLLCSQSSFSPLACLFGKKISTLFACSRNKCWVASNECFLLRKSNILISSVSLSSSFFLRFVIIGEWFASTASRASDCDSLLSHYFPSLSQSTFMTFGSVL
jgi:hypothetical protein